MESRDEKLKSERLKRVRTRIDENRRNGRFEYEGLSSDEIGLYNGALMWGDHDEAFDEGLYRLYTR